METTRRFDPELAAKPPSTSGAGPVVATERCSEPEAHRHQPMQALQQEELENDPLQLMPRLQKNLEQSGQKDQKSVPVAKAPPPPPPQLCKEETDMGVENVVARTSAKSVAASTTASAGGVGNANAALVDRKAKASVDVEAETPQLVQSTTTFVSAKTPGRPTKSDNKDVKATSSKATGTPTVLDCKNLKAKAAPAEVPRRPSAPASNAEQATSAEAPGRPSIPEQVQACTIKMPGEHNVQERQTSEATAAESPGRPKSSAFSTAQAAPSVVTKSEPSPGPSVSSVSLENSKAATGNLQHQHGTDDSLQPCFHAALPKEEAARLSEGCSGGLNSVCTPTVLHTVHEDVAATTAMGPCKRQVHAQGQMQEVALPSWNLAPDLINVKLMFNGKTKLVRHSSATKISEIRGQHQANHASGALVVKDASNFEMGSEVKLGQLVTHPGELLTLYLEPDVW